MRNRVATFVELAYTDGYSIEYFGRKPGPY